MNKKIIINGFPCSGKDTFVEFVREILSEAGVYIQCKNVSSVEKVKVAARLLGWDGHKDEKGRKFLSDLKDMSTKLYDGPMQFMSEYMCDNWKNVVVFFHIREPSEIVRFVKRFPETKTLFIKRNTVSFDNHADSNVGDYVYDYVIENFSTLEEFKKQANVFVNEVIK